MKLYPYLTLYTKINSKWIKDLNIRAETTKLLVKNIEGKLYDIEFHNDFLAMTPKEKIDKLYYIKIKNFVQYQEILRTISRSTRTHRMGENTC